MSKVRKQAFNAGYAIAVANIMHLHNESTLAADVLKESGITLPEIEELGLTDYDLDELRALYRENDCLQGLREDRTPGAAK